MGQGGQRAHVCRAIDGQASIQGTNLQARHDILRHETKAIGGTRAGGNCGGLRRHVRMTSEHGDLGISIPDHWH